MMSQKSTLLATMLAMAPLAANAHMIMANPVPYGHPNNSPLDPSGSDFPCKAVPYTVNTMNEWPVGSSQYLSFTGSAVHGGGSCQISVTTDKAPTKDSKWKAIYSIEGGCPASVAGNLDESKNEDGRFNFTIPPELPNGEMSMSWTWYNKVGNREMYMNCGPIKISGGANDNTAFDALPDMAVANLATTPNCKTKESSDYTFENPGKHKISAGTGPFVSLCDGTPSTPATGGDAPAAAPAPAPQQPAAPQSPPANPGNSSACRAPSQAPVQTSTLRTMITVTAPLGPAPTSAQGNVSAPPANSLSAPQPSQAPAAPAAPAPAPGSGTANGTSCSPDGSILCNGETQFGICNHGTVVWQDVAAGTKCQNGAIAKRDYAHRNMRTAF